MNQVQQEQDTEFTEQNPYRPDQQGLILVLNHGRISQYSPELKMHVTRLKNLKITQKLLTLLLGWNQNPCVLDYIYNSRFSSLRVLSINGNKIQSIEALTKVQFPALKHLEICDNDIISLKQIRKMTMPNLKEINFINLKINHADDFGFSQCDWQNLKAVIIDDASNQTAYLAKGNYELQFLRIGKTDILPQYIEHRFLQTVPIEYLYDY